MSAAEVLLGRLQGVKPRGRMQWVARCPAHKDRSPSLSIKELADGRVLLNDFAGCSIESILDALGLEFTDLFPERLGDHLQPIARAGSHVHAAADALKVIAHEALLVALAAEELAAGMPLTPADRERVLEASAIIRAAASVV